MLCCDILRIFTLVIDSLAACSVSCIFFYFCASLCKSTEIKSKLVFSSADTGPVFGPSMNPHVALMLLKRDFTLLTLLNSSSMTFC